ncbi:MAG: sodium-dependent bicarbonate transport family permease [Granulosicoccus sp.]
MEFLFEFLSGLVAQFQKPTLAFLIGGMVLAACRSKLEVPEPVYKFIVLLLLLKIGLGAGISVRESDLVALIVPALGAAIVGVAIVLIGVLTLASRQQVAPIDGIATAGVFGAVSASTLAAGMAVLDTDGIAYEGFIGALYPFMDIAALVTAIVLGRISLARKNAAPAIQTSAQGTLSLGGGMPPGISSVSGADSGMIKKILVDTVRSPAISALLLGLAIGLFAKPDSVYESFYEPLFRGLLSVLMLIMGAEAWARISEMRKVASTYVIYGIAGPLLHGMLGFAAGLIAHHLTGFSAGGVVLLSIMAASSSDISGPPTVRAALPEANPSAYIGCSTGIGTPVAILSIPLFIGLAEMLIGF